MKTNEQHTEPQFEEGIAQAIDQIARFCVLVARDTQQQLDQAVESATNKSPINKPKYDETKLSDKRHVVGSSPDVAGPTDDQN